MTIERTKPFVSVCIPVFNGGTYLSQTLDSVLSQTYQNFELLVQDNCSSDGTGSILAAAVERDGRTIVEKNATVLSMAENWNTVINRARGEFVMLLSADDLLFPGFLADCVQILQDDPQLDVVSVEHELLRGREKRPRRIKVESGKRSLSCHEVLLKNPFSINFSLFRHASLAANMLSTNRVFRQPYFTCDYDLWLRLSFSQVSVYFVKYPLATYRVHHGALSRKIIKMIKHTVLVLSANRYDLEAKCGLMFKLTLARILARLFYYRLRGVGRNRRLESLVIARLLAT